MLNTLQPTPNTQPSESVRLGTKNQLSKHKKELTMLLQGLPLQFNTINSLYNYLLF